MSADEVLATLAASGPRRVFACGVMGALGALLIYLGVLLAPAFLWSLGFVAAGALVAWMGWRQWQITTMALELTEHELRTTTGLTLVAVNDIERIDRGALAFKPSQGFMLRTKSHGPRLWAPGLYWRLGRAIGIGGVTQAGQAKFMAQTLEALIAHRDGGA
ncbi:MAG: hypothetical protein AAF841_10585 [Pseudomonadota bacterium]